MHTITMRAPTQEEQTEIRDGFLQGYAVYGYRGLLLLGLAVTFGVMGRFAGGWVAPGAAVWVRGICGVVACIFGIASFVFLFTFFGMCISARLERRLREGVKRDIEARQVQEIRVDGARVVQIGLVSDNEPILAFDIGAGKILFLQGQWLRDNQTYGAPETAGDDAPDDFVNLQPAPHSFPSDAFTVVRLPHAGAVLGIRVRGQYLAAGPEVEALRIEYDFCDSELLTGELDAIAEVLATEHERRRAQESRRA